MSEPSDSKPSSRRQSKNRRVLQSSKHIMRSRPTPTRVESTSGFIDYNTVPRSRIGYMTTMRACVAMMQALESHHEKSPMIPEPAFQNPPDDSLDEEKLNSFEYQINDLEDRVKLISRRINECRRGQKLLNDRVLELETSVRKSKEINLIKSLMNVVPTSDDLLLLEKIKEEEARQRTVRNRIKNVESQNKVLTEIMGRAEAIITDSRIIKKQKRVVIVEEEPVVIGETCDKGRALKKIVPILEEEDTKVVDKHEMATEEEIAEEPIPITIGKLDELDFPIMENIIVDEVDMLTRRSSKDYFDFHINENLIKDLSKESIVSETSEEDSDMKIDETGQTAETSKNGADIETNENAGTTEISKNDADIETNENAETTETLKNDADIETNENAETTGTSKNDADIETNENAVTTGTSKEHIVNETNENAETTETSKDDADTETNEIERTAETGEQDTVTETNENAEIAETSKSPAPDPR
ncbi:hypothetical protein O3M35_005993 [Rhynocoris fuscipes]